MKSTFPLGPLGAIFHKWHTDFHQTLQIYHDTIVVCWFMICNSEKHQRSKQVTLHDGSRFHQNPLKDTLGFSIYGFLKMKAHENGVRVTCHSCTVPHRKNAKKSPIRQRRPQDQWSFAAGLSPSKCTNPRFEEPPFTYSQFTYFQSIVLGVGSVLQKQFIIILGFAFAFALTSLSVQSINQSINKSINQSINQ